MARTLPEVFGRYRILRELGAGGMGTVYLARDTKLDREVALKVPSLGGDGPAAVDLDRFFREARAAASVSHPNVCPIFDVGEIDGTPYLTMAYLEGQPLSHLVKPAGLMSPDRAALIVRKLALALQEAHSRGVIHRDLKPSNVMVTPRGEPVVMDFGLARRDRTIELRLTKTDAIMGTPAYMAPEQIGGDSSKIGPACDIHALGVILYELLTGRLPFQGPGLAIFAQIVAQKPVPPSRYRPGLDATLEALCLKGMAKNPADRHASMADLAAALTDYLRTAQAPARPGALAAPAADPVLPTRVDSPTPPAADPWATVHAVDTFVSHQPRGDAPAPTAPASSPNVPPAPGPAPALAPLPASAPEARPGRRVAEPRRRRNWSLRPGWPLVVAGGATLLLMLFLLGQAVVDEFGHGWVKVAISEPGATVDVVLDGKPVAKSTLNELIRLTTGEHHLLVAGTPYQRWSRTFSIAHGVNPALEVLLVPIGPALRPEPPAAKPEPAPAESKEVVNKGVEPKKETRLEPVATKSKETAKKVVEPKKEAPQPVIAAELLTTRVGQIKLKLIAASMFLMGSPDDDKEAYNNEKPQHRVSISRPFYMGVYEVTQAQYRAVMGINPSSFSAKGRTNRAVAAQPTDRHPVENVSWLDAVRFCNKLSELEGLKPFFGISGVPDWNSRGYRLPTEAEWEYACRGNTPPPTRYSFGDDPASLGEYAWYIGNARGTTHPVGEKQPNQFGLYDMHGSVWEWCWDGYREGYHRGSPDVDPRGADGASRRVARGGSWYDSPRSIRSAYRVRYSPGSRGNFLGFRLARVQ
jgi:formylglycine-generating enzyme required for sulfatase activity/serine/threonine protein kinase